MQRKESSLTLKIGARLLAFYNHYTYPFNRIGFKSSIPALKYADIHAASSLVASYTLS